MLAIVMTVCALGIGDNCRDVRLNFEAENATPMQCALYGQVEMAKWVDEHPNFAIRKWRCGPPDTFAKI